MRPDVVNAIITPCRCLSDVGEATLMDICSPQRRLAYGISSLARWRAAQDVALL